MKHGSWIAVGGVARKGLRCGLVWGIGLILLGTGLVPAAQAETDFAALFPPPAPRVDQTPLPQEVLADQSFAFVGEEHAKLINEARNLAALGPDLFGDQTNLQTGSTEFIHTDIDLPGNNGLPVRLQRRFTAASKRGLNLVRPAAFADWELDVPYLSGEFADAIGWRVDVGAGQSSDQRCSITAPAHTVPPSIEVPGFPQPELFRPLDYWHGYNLHLPGGGGGELLWLSPTNTTQKPSDGPTYYWATNGNWFFSCANGAPGVGEIFVGRSPEGLRYTFGQMVNRAASRLSANGSTAKLLRTEVRLVATRVEDRFGNWVAYNWNGSRLASISASDGRSITFTYDPTTGFVSSASDGTRTWSYGYSGTGSITIGSRTAAPSLSRVIRPDNSAWAISFASLAKAIVTSERQTADCTASGSLNEGANHEFTGSITHPSGAIGTFTFGPVRHGRTRVPRFCVNEDALGNVGDDYSWFTLTYDVLALKTKRIVGGALPTQQWDYVYAPDWCFADGDGACSAGTRDYSTTTVVQLGAGVDQYRFGTVYQGNEGKLLKVEHGISVTVNGTLQGVIGSEESLYQLDGSSQVYPSPIGGSPQPRGDAFTAENFLPLRQKAISQDGANFTWEALSFDRYAQPIQVKRSSSLGFDKTELTTYRNDTSLWLIGQTESVQDGETSLIEQLNQFFPNGQVSASFAFGDLQSRFQYYPDGSVQSITDGRGNATTLSNYFRGVPRLVQYADGAAQSATVGPIGTLGSITDAMGFTSNFLYDSIGRLRQIDYPSADSTAWNATTRSFAPVASIEFGIPAGHWKLIEQTGTGRTSTFYDAFWRPVLVLTEDTSNPSTRSFVVNRYDAKGRLAFSSYPVASLVSINDSLLGTSTQYDLLGRPTEVRQDSELGPLLTRSVYLPGFQTQVTDPRGQVTTTRYQAFDTPSTEAPMSIVAPDQSTTTFTRDDFGKPLSVTRSSNGG